MGDWFFFGCSKGEGEMRVKNRFCESLLISQGLLRLTSQTASRDFC